MLDVPIAILPNDPRGSNSDLVRAPHLVPFGKATKVENRRNVAREPHDYRLRQEAKRAMLYPAVEFTGAQALSVGRGFGTAARKNGYVIYACAILPRHIHLVIRPHRYRIEQVVNLLKGAATRQLLHDGLHRLAEYRDRRGRIPSPFQEECGHEFLYTVDDMWRAIKYVRDNPLKEKKPVQRWSFVMPYDGT